MKQEEPSAPCSFRVAPHTVFSYGFDFLSAQVFVRLSVDSMIT